jgi:hypothetical protein
MRLRDRLTTAVAAVLLCVLGASSLSGCTAGDEETDAAANRTRAVTHSVTLRVTGEGWPEASVSFTADDEKSPIETVPLPWSTEIDYDSADTLWLFAVFTYLPGRNTTGSTLTCEILVDGKSVSSVEARARPSDDGQAVVEEPAICDYTPTR